MNKELMKIQAELKAPKGQYNSFGKYKYRSAEDILEAVKPLLVANEGQLTLSDEVLEIGGRFYIKATASFESKSGSVNIVAYAREDDNKKGMDGSQITGTASSYARKYALNGLFLIDDTKDADTDAYHKQTHQEDKVVDYDYLKQQLEASTTMKQLQAVWTAMSAEARKTLEPVKNEMKNKLSKAS